MAVLFAAEFSEAVLDGVTQHGREAWPQSQATSPALHLSWGADSSSQTHQLQLRDMLSNPVFPPLRCR